MNYELALKLKDAGFPQTFTGFESFDLNTENKPTPEHGVPVYKPTLSELIEACGDKLHSIRRGGWKGSSLNGWMASEDSFYEMTMNTVPKEPVGTGSTPKEAVANLWLVLNS